MATITIKTGDTAPAVEATLSDDNGAVDLTGATVRFLMGAGGDPPVVDAAATLVDPAAGQVRYDWAAGDTAEAGIYRAEWEITWPDATVQTVPSDGYDTVLIHTDLN